MTLLVSWIGVDTHGTASAYIAADSRISWGNKAKFDHGRKVFALSSFPDILGYCGDVLFPTMVLSQIAEMADRGVLFSNNPSCKDRFEAIKEKLVQQFHQYPRMVDEITANSLQVLHIARSLKNNFQFECRLIEWTRIDGWKGKMVDLPKISGVLFSLGSGASEFVDNLVRYNSGPNKGTSRSIFHCFCDSLFKIKDPYCGGAPQLVGIYRKPESPAISFGIVIEKKRYFLGAPVDKNVELEMVEWRNDLFELCDGHTMKKFSTAQKQPDLLRR